MKKISTYILITITILLLTGLSSAFANSDIFIAPEIPQPSTLPGQGHETRLSLTQSVLPAYAVGLIGFVAMAALLFVIIAGVRFVTSYGNEEAIENAKKQVIYSIVALLVALSAYAIVTIIINFQFEGNQSVQDTRGDYNTQPVTENLA